MCALGVAGMNVRHSRWSAQEVPVFASFIAMCGQQAAFRDEAAIRLAISGSVTPKAEGLTEVCESGVACPR